MMTLVSPVPSKAIKKNANTSVGKVRNMSHTRIRNMSSLPPITPAMPPITTPSIKTSPRVNTTLPNDS